MLIFDFDQTLVDTREATPFRRTRNWTRVRTIMRGLEPYPGITGLLGELHTLGQPMAILTTSPDMVAREFSERHQWPIKPEFTERSRSCRIKGHGRQEQVRWSLLSQGIRSAARPGSDAAGNLTGRGGGEGL